jgi:hypothetical protein
MEDGLVHVKCVIDFGMSSFAAIPYSQYITRKYTEYTMTPMDIKQAMDS